MTREARTPVTTPGGAPIPRACRGCGRCLVMGVVNVTPDSFSDGGAWLEPAAAMSHGLQPGR